MKKAIFTILSSCVLFMLPAAAFADGPSIVLSTTGANNNYPDQIAALCGDTALNTGVFVHADGGATDMGPGNGCPLGPFTYPSPMIAQGGVQLPNGTEFDVVFFDVADVSACSEGPGVPGNENLCITDFGGTVQHFWSTDLGFSLTPWPPSPQDWIDTASTTFSGTTGFDIGGSVTFAAAALYSIVLGSGLLMFKLLMPWIIALAIIFAVVYFLYRAFRFYKH